jgi:hypothetical protein
MAYELNPWFTDPPPPPPPQSDTDITKTGRDEPVKPKKRS